MSGHGQAAPLHTQETQCNLPDHTTGDRACWAQVCAKLSLNNYVCPNLCSTSSIARDMVKVACIGFFMYEEVLRGMNCEGSSELPPWPAVV
jgi:hypothetical protein